MDGVFFAKFPFLPQSREFLDFLNVEITDELLERGFARASVALKPPHELALKTFFGDGSRELSEFVASRMLVLATGSPRALATLAVSESKLCHKYFKELSELDKAKLLDLSGVQVKKSDDGAFRASLSSFLKFSPPSPDYKLSLRDVKDGWVRISNHERGRLFEECARQKFELKPAGDPTRVSAFQPYAKRLLDLLPKPHALPATNIKEEEFAPCMKELLTQMRSGVNLSHSARFALAAFLLKTGLSVDSVVSVFSASPDYDEKVARYHTEHISKKGYSVPSCATLETHGICNSKCGCGSPIYCRSNNDGTTYCIRQKKSDRDAGN